MNNRYIKVITTKLFLIATLFSALNFPLSAQQKVTSFYPEGTYDSKIPKPGDIWGFSLGERPSRYDDVVHYLKVLAEKSARVKLVETGKTFEGRALYYVLISSEENMNKINSIKNELDKIADPRKIKSQDEADKITDSMPAIAWMMYSVHGDELSGVDAAVEAAYQLAAGTDAATMNILKNVIVGIDPMQNPDGRERYLLQQFAWKTNLSMTDQQSIQHTGNWPWGRTNHYFFDMNRDWFILSQPETRSRAHSLLEWHPQLVVDVHEQGRNSSYFFNPPREPINPLVNKDIRKWWKVFASDQAKAFDKYGWSYFTRENYEDWYPGYGNGLPYYMSAVGILYEQARTDGYALKQSDGNLLTYRESVRHQFVSTIANLTTLANNRVSVLKDYYRMKREAIGPNKDGIAAYIIDPAKNPSRAARLINRLRMNGIEVSKADNNFKTNNLKTYWNSKSEKKDFPAGSYIISTSQPLSPILNVILEFDPRMTTNFLKSERESLEKGKGTRFYDASAWSMLLAYGVDAYSSPVMPAVKKTNVEKVTQPAGEVINDKPQFGFLINYSDDNSVGALVALLKDNYKVRISEKPFKVEGHSFERGSILIRINENSPEIFEGMKNIAESANVKIYGINTALAENGPDLGGNEFDLLAIPKIAVLTGPSIDLTDFGAIWYMLDQELKYPYSIINSNYFSRIDLRKYNVLVLPSSSVYSRIFNKGDIAKIKDWISNGGTLIGIENAAAFIADSSTKLSKVRLRSQSLTQLKGYKEALKAEENIGHYQIDSTAFWSSDKFIKVADTQKTKTPDLEILKRADAAGRLFKPEGAILNVKLNSENWITFGLTDKIPAIMYTKYAFLAKNPVQIPARFSDAEHIRLSGLMWPEARLRLANTAYATREASGNGQIILFAGEPNWRSYFYETQRLFINSLLLGPGLGTRPAGYDK